MAISLKKILTIFFYCALYAVEILRDPAMRTLRSQNGDRWNQDRIPSSPDCILCTQKKQYALRSDACQRPSCIAQAFQLG